MPTDDGVCLRTAKACGPDASTLASRVATMLRIALAIAGDARHRPLKPFACGNAGCSGATVVTCLRAFYLLHARLRARLAPGIPHALKGGWIWHHPGGKPSRGGFAS